MLFKCIKFNGQIYFIRQGNIADLKAICSLIKQLQPDMHVLIHTYLSFLRQKNYYIYILEDNSKKIIGFDIRYAVNKNTLCLHEDGILLEYSFLSQIFRTSLLIDSANMGYKFLYTHIQDFSQRTISYLIQLNSNIIGYQKNRWLDHYKNMTLSVNSLYFSVPLEHKYILNLSYDYSITLISASYQEKTTKIRNI